MLSCTKCCHKYDFNSSFFTHFPLKKLKMLSDSDILEQLDDILANEESGDEFLDELFLDDDSGT